MSGKTRPGCAGLRRTRSSSAFGRRSWRRVLGTLAALGLSRPEMPWRRTIMAILISPMIVPIIITGTGMFFFYSKPLRAAGMGGDRMAVRAADRHLVTGIVMAHAMLGIPFVIITVTATLVGFDQSLARAAASLGANPRTVFFKIIMPLILPGVISGALFAFVTSFDEVVAILLIGGPNSRRSRARCGTASANRSARRSCRWPRSLSSFRSGFWRRSRC